MNCPIAATSAKRAATRPMSGLSFPLVPHDRRPRTRSLGIESSAFRVGCNGLRRPRPRSLLDSVGGRVRQAFQVFGLERVELLS